MHERRWHDRWITVALVSCLATCGAAWSPLPVEDDPLVRMPGTQPGQVVLEGPRRCTNCHSGYDDAVEPVSHWQGSMMAQAARDFLFWSCLTVTAQDSVWAIGRPNAVDICERCHFPQGWLEGRSDPPNASAMTDSDFDGVHCDFCHASYDPFFETTHDGTREGSDWLNYWDETNTSATPSQPAADAAYAADALLAQTITMFNGDPFYSSSNKPASASYTESGAGQYFVSGGGEKRASFADADGRHAMLYSRYHKSRSFCAACHDVSNPVLANLAYEGTPPGDGVTELTTETVSAASYAHVERTFSEFALSAYGQQGGADGVGPFDPSLFTTSLPGNKIARCQDCHMADGTGQAASMRSAVNRPSGSVEHPQSGQPVHEQTGGNAWVSRVLASAVAGSPNYDAVNDALLNQGPLTLTLDLAAGLGIDPTALLAGADRAVQQLQMAASLENGSYDPVTGIVTFRVRNQTGHKLISGFPEGRRMFLNVRVYRGGTLVRELNPYDTVAGTLKGLSYAYSTAALPAVALPTPLGPGEEYRDALVYEMQPTSALTGELKTFHFALATGRYKDNRIPPQGFDISQAAARLVEPVWHGASDPGYYTPAEYDGGYDEVSIATIPWADTVEITLYYQTTSREYIEFLRDEINGTASTLPGTGAGGDPPYIAQTDPFFSQLRAWGDTIWELWTHNMNETGAAPVLMAQQTLLVDLVTDTDGDGMPDTWETAYALDPGDPGDADDDPDDDGQDNLFECRAGTHPRETESLFCITRVEQDVGGTAIDWTGLPPFELYERRGPDAGWTSILSDYVGNTYTVTVPVDNCWFRVEADR